MAAKPDGARQYLKMCACGREFNGAPILEKVTNYYKEAKALKKVLTSDIIKPERKDGANHENKMAYKKATGILKSER
jgi:hypothetical protein